MTGSMVVRGVILLAIAFLVGFLVSLFLESQQQDRTRVEIRFPTTATSECSQT